MSLRGGRRPPREIPVLAKGTVRLRPLTGTFEKIKDMYEVRYIVKIDGVGGQRIISEREFEREFEIDRVMKGEGKS